MFLHLFLFSFSSSSHFSRLSGHFSRMLSGPAHRSPFPPGLRDGAERRAQQSKRRRYAFLPPLWWRCLGGPGDHHPLLQLCYSLCNHRRHHVRLLHHHPISAAVCPHGTFPHCLHGRDEGWEDAWTTCQVRSDNKLDIFELIFSIAQEMCIF